MEIINIINIDRQIDRDRKTSEQKRNTEYLLIISILNDNYK